LLQVGPLGLTASEPNDQLFVDSLHLSPEGNRLMAGLLADQLAAAGF
jgi:lysophospholipase L1-like esterase